MLGNEPQPKIDWPHATNELPKDIFIREDVYRAELERIFHGDAWHMLGHVAEVPKAGDFKTVRLGETPLLIVRGSDERVRVFLNSCPHRGTQLQTRSRGYAAEIQCPYHRWLFDNCGNLVAAPGIERFPADFRKEEHGMTELRSAQVAGIVFATWSTAAPDLDEFLGPAKATLQKAAGGDGRLRLLGYQKVIYSSNWKECSDNEGYHAPLLHRAFRLLRWQGGKGVQFVTDHAHKVIEAELKKLPPSGFLDDNSLVEFRDPNSAPQSFIVQLFPLNSLIRHFDVINMRCGFPLSPHETEIHYAYFGHEDDDQEMLRHRVRQASNLLGPSGFISLEDGAVFNRIHQGARTPGTVAFQKGVRGPSEPPSGEQNDEASNLIKWDYYRQVMGFERG